jgi:hypothetical protein
VTNAKQELDLRVDRFLMFPGVEAFIGTLAGVFSTHLNEVNTIHFRLVVRPNYQDMATNQIMRGTPLYKPADLAELKSRYTIMLNLLDQLIQKNFKVLRLEIAAKSGLSGSMITVLTPSGRKHEFNYLREEQGVSLIPMDFLKDLSKLPDRLI